MSATNRALGITEVLVMIFKHLYSEPSPYEHKHIRFYTQWPNSQFNRPRPRRGWLNPALVCKRWRDIAMPFIWEEPLSFECLIKTFPRDLLRLDTIKSEYSTKFTWTLIRSITKEDWAAFDHYASAVRCFPRLEALDHHRISESIYLAMLQFQSASTWFPGLENLLNYAGIPTELLSQLVNTELSELYLYEIYLVYEGCGDSEEQAIATRARLMRFEAKSWKLKHLTISGEHLKVCGLELLTLLNEDSLESVEIEVSPEDSFDVPRLEPFMMKLSTIQSLTSLSVEGPEQLLQNYGGWTVCFPNVTYLTLAFEATVNPPLLMFSVFKCPKIEHLKCTIQLAEYDDANSSDIVRDVTRAFSDLLNPDTLKSICVGTESGYDCPDCQLDPQNSHLIENESLIEAISRFPKLQCVRVWTTDWEELDTIDFPEHVKSTRPDHWSPVEENEEPETFQTYLWKRYLTRTMLRCVHWGFADS